MSVRAAVMRGGAIVTDSIELPAPAAGQVRVATLACGICGSDLHALQHGELLVATSRETGGSFNMDLQRDVIMGHEFCAEVLEHGPDTDRRFAAGTQVVSVPVARHQGRLATLGYSNTLPGGYAEQMLLEEARLLPVPNGLPTSLAALTEPMAVGAHAVAMSNLEAGDVPLVIGCGPVGLAVITALKQAGVEPIVAADYSHKRRTLAASVGAHEVVDPARSSPYASWRELASRAPDDTALPPHAMTGGPALRQAVFFDCVGVPGIVDQLMANAPRGARIVVVGVCMQQDSIRPLIGINKELNLQFVLGYSVEEFASTLHNIAEGEVDLSPLITGTVDIDGVASAFEALADPEQHAKILVTPGVP